MVGRFAVAFFGAGDCPAADINQHTLVDHDDLADFIQIFLSRCD